MVQVPPPQPKQIPLLIQSCRQRYRYFTEKNIDRISTYKNKRCILGVFRPFCNAFLIVFIVPPRDLTQHSCWPIVKIPLLVKRLKWNTKRSSAYMVTWSTVVCQRVCKLLRPKRQAANRLLQPDQSDRPRAGIKTSEKPSPRYAGAAVFFCQKCGSTHNTDPKNDQVMNFRFFGVWVLCSLYI